MNEKKMINSKDRRAKVKSEKGEEKVILFCKQKKAYEMRMSDWSSDVCSSDLVKAPAAYSAGVLSKPISFSNGVKTEEEVQALDALAEIREMTFRSYERRVGNACFSTCRSRLSSYH